MRTFAIMFSCFVLLSACHKDGGDDDPGTDGGTGSGDCTPGELGCAPTGIPGSGSCHGPEYSIDCGDGFCWPEGTDCSMRAYACAGETFRCNEASERAGCCEGLPVLCPAEAPYYCPDEGGCSTNGGCSVGDVCEFVDSPCN